MQAKKLSILIVDDNSYYTKRMTDILKELDNISTVNTAGNFDEAFTMLDTKDHDMVLLDIKLPGGSGMDLLKKIKQSDKDCEVIMVSNCTDEFYKKQCKKLGASYFIDKTKDFEMVPVLLRE
jgi:DNA-binding NarL/FixJ family response regulator